MHMFPCNSYYILALKVLRMLLTREVPELPPLDGVQPIQYDLCIYRNWARIKMGKVN